MSGIYVVFDPRGLEPARRASFQARVNALAGRLPTDRLEFGGHAVAVMASVHHGHFASGGVARDGAGVAAVAGTCWRAGAVTLATPAQLVAGVPESVHQETPPWHGVFGLAHADESTCKLTVISDRFGAHPLYWRLDAGVITVASSLRFLAEPGRDRPDLDVLADLLNFAYSPREETLLASVRRLHAHHVLEAGTDGVRTRPLPVPPPTRSRPVTDDVVRDLDELVARGLRRHAQLPDSPAGGSFSIALSGGLDSRLVAGAAKHVGLPMQGFTVGERRSLEAHTAARVAEGLGIPNASLLVDGATLPDWFREAAWFTEGRTGANHMHYLGPAFAGRLPAGPQLHGLIGEGIIGGYEERLSLMDATPAERLHACREAVGDMVWWPEGRARQVLSPALAGSLEQARAHVLDVQERRLWKDGTFSETSAFTFQTVTVGFRVPNLVSQVTPWTDVVSPFLDGELLDFAGTLDPHGMADRALQIRWGLDCMPGFDAVPRLKDGVLIPVQLGIPHYYDEAIGRIWRRKRLNFLACRLTGGRLNPPDRGSFPYFGQWYRRWPGVRRFIDGILLDERSLDRGLWNREGMRALLRDLRTGREVWSAVGTLLLCEMLLRQWCDGVDRPADQVTPLLANAGDPDGAGR